MSFSGSMKPKTSVSKRHLSMSSRPHTQTWAIRLGYAKKRKKSELKRYEEKNLCCWYVFEIRLRIIPKNEHRFVGQWTYVEWPLNICSWADEHMFIFPPWKHLKKLFRLSQKFGTSKLGVWHKQTRSSVQANLKFGTAKLEEWFFCLFMPF